MASSTRSEEQHQPDDAGKREERPLRPGEWHILALLGVPTLALALSITTVTTYLPVRLQTGKASTTTIGLLIGIEGLLALVVPIVAGAWSDQLRTRLGGRLPFILAATPFLAVALAVLGFTHSIGLAAIVVAVFFAAYYVAYEPYRALYPDLVGNEIAGRAQSTQAVFRGAGTFLALVGGGLLIALAAPAPFLVAAGVVLLALGGFAAAVTRRGVPEQEQPKLRGLRANARHLWSLITSRRELRLYLCANSLWELSLGALKTFVVLYLTRGLGFRVATSSLLIGAVALFVLAASPLSGKLGDRYGRTRVMQIALVVYGAGLLVPFLLTAKPVIAIAAPAIAMGGGAVMTLPYALLMPLMEDQEHGALTGFYSFTRGIGIALGPILAGVAISLTRGLFSGTHGYQATWGVCAAAILLSLVPLGRLRRAQNAAADGRRGR